GHHGSILGRVLKASDGMLYWSLDNGGGVIKSGDGGVTWTLVGGQQIVYSTIQELPDGRLGAFNNNGRAWLVSADHGTTWKVGASLPYDITSFIYSSFRKQLIV